METTKCLNGELIPGDFVISAPDDEYGCLIGIVLQITKVGTPEHEAETENAYDNVHVNFYEANYSGQRVKEIEAMFTELYDEEKQFDELPIDDTIMAPDSLFRITGIAPDKLNKALGSYEAAADLCESMLREQVLIDRLEKNLAEDRAYWMLQDKDALYDSAGLIAATKDAHYYLVEVHIFEPEEVSYLLKFENPLEVVADEWNTRKEDLSDFSFALDYVCNRQQALEGGYSLTEEAIEDQMTKLQRDEGIDDLSR